MSALRRIGTLAFLLLACACGSAHRVEQRLGRPLHVVLITLDTFRTDRLAIAGGAEDLTPNLNRLAAEGVYFSRAYTTNPVTAPAHASILTGRWPFHHGVRDNNSFRIPESETTLAERFQAAGWDTAAVVSALPVTSAFGMGQGFGIFDEQMPGARSVMRGEARRDGMATVQLFEKIYAGRTPGTRSFDWVHLYDAHWPYHPPPSYLLSGRSSYDACVAYTDAQVGEVVRVIRERGEDALLVIVGDHGEGLGDHGEEEHGILVYEPMMHVPLLLWTTRGPASHVRDEPVSVVDVAPTILRLADLPAAGGTIDGVDLLRGKHPSGCYLESMHPYVVYDYAPLRGLVDERWKFISTALPELYDLGADPGETSNLHYKAPETAALMQQRLAAFGADAALTPNLDLDEQQMEALRGLGYTGDFNTARRGGDQPDPKELVSKVARLKEASSALGAGDLQRALSLLAATAQDFPNVVAVQRGYATVLGQAGRWDEAELYYARALALKPEDASSRFGMGTVQDARGNPAGAVEHYREACRLSAENADFQYALGRAADLSGDPALCAQAWRRYLELRPDAPDRDRVEVRLHELGVTAPAKGVP